MLTKFVCPDGEEQAIKDCLKKCRMGKRCLTKPTLMCLSQVREWTGVPSVTQLLKGTYESFLSIIHDYSESPDSMAFRLLGTSVHAGLEDIEDDSMMIETRLTGKDGISGASDLVETEEGWNVLTDYKTSGSYKVAKALGVYETTEESKTEFYKQKTYVTIDGEKVAREKGSPKIIKTKKFSMKYQDCKDWIYQLNKYRIDIEEAKGIKIDEMRIQAIIRDGGTITAINRGLDKNIYFIPIPHVDNKEIKDYFLKKKDDLLKALKDGDWGMKCSPEECWDGRKCEKYCSVKKYCKFMRE